MNTTSTLIELINTSQLTPPMARDVVITFIRSHFREFKKKHFLIFLDSTKGLCAGELVEFSSCEELTNWHAHLPGRYEFLLLTFDGLVLEAAFRTKLISWIHHFDHGSDYEYHYCDRRQESAGKFNEKAMIEKIEKAIFEKLVNPTRSN